MSDTPRTDALLNTHGYNSIPPIEQRYVIMCNHARQLERELSARESITPIEETDDSIGDWQCKDYGDGWITFPTRKAAEHYQEQTGALMRYVRYYKAMLAAAEAK